MGVDDFFCSQRHQGMALVLFLGCDARARLERVRKARALVRVTARHRAFDRARSSNDFTLCVSITNHLVALHAARERGGGFTSDAAFFVSKLPRALRRRAPASTIRRARRLLPRTRTGSMRHVRTRPARARSTPRGDARTSRR